MTDILGLLCEELVGDVEQCLKSRVPCFVHRMYAQKITRGFECPCSGEAKQKPQTFSQTLHQVDRGARVLCEDVAC